LPPFLSKSKAKNIFWGRLRRFFLKTFCDPIMDKREFTTTLVSVSHAETQKYIYYDYIYWKIIANTRFGVVIVWGRN